MDTWVTHAVEVIFRAGQADKGWGYRLGGSPSVEPTVLVCLALAATSDSTDPNIRVQKTLSGAAEWLARLQQDDGAVGVRLGLPQPKWSTSFAILLWSILANYEAQQKKAVMWLLDRKGLASSDTPITGHNDRLVGWPWVAETHSWLEPTAMAMIALQKTGHAGHARVEEGVRVVIDRAVPTGGWNYGNSTALGSELRAQPDPTGQALAAIAHDERAAEVAGPAIEYLERVLPTTRAARSLAWGIMGATAWDRRPTSADRWLSEAATICFERQEPPYLLAMLILASQNRSLEQMGIRRFGIKIPHEKTNEAIDETR